MCLDVEKSHVRKPIHEMECFKILRYVGGNVWETPFQDKRINRGTGWFKPLNPAKRKVREYRKCEEIEGGYIHAYTDPEADIWWNSADGVHDKMPKKANLKPGKCYRFRCVARDVVALGISSDIVCRALYIPAFDITSKHRNAILDM